MTDTQMSAFLSSTSKFYIQYSGYLFNHLAHGIVSLERLGADSQRIQKFIDWYTPRLEYASKFKTDKEILDVTSPMGTLKSFYSLKDAYEKHLYEKCGGSLEKLIKDRFPRLFPGLMGSALHGIIHLGYGYAAKNEQLVIEGLAYIHFSYLPLKWSSESVAGTKDIGKGSRNITDVIDTIRSDTLLQNSMNSMVKNKEYAGKEVGTFQRKVMVLFNHHADELLRYALQIEIPVIARLESDVEQLLLYKWLLDSAISVYTLTERRNDFFLLHGVTAAWSLSQVAPVGIGNRTDMVQELVATYLCTLFAVYLTQGTPALCPDLLKQDVADEGSGTTWDSIINIVLTEDCDEHIYKMVQICHDLTKDCQEMELKNLYLNAALCAIHHPLAFTPE